jgi:hypothetical protein
MSPSVASPNDWSDFTRDFAICVVGLFAAFFLFILAIDPYDTGRTGLFRAAGVPDQFPTTANASRSRDPDFNAAIIGNSRVQQLSPDRLHALTGLRFVSLILPGSRPADQLALLRWYLEVRTDPPRAIVLGMDAWWCSSDFALSARFPAWLYDPSFASYLVGLVRWRSVEASFRRIAFLRTGKNGARPDGYWDYRPIFRQMGLEDAEASHAKISDVRLSAFEANPSGDLPGIDRLSEVVDDLPADTMLIVLRPPIHMNGWPRQGTPEAQAAERCAARVAALATARPNVRVIDLLGSAEFAASMGNFYDFDHYRDPVAAEIEKRVAVALAGMRPRPPRD